MGRLISLSAALGTVALVTLGAPAVADPANSPKGSVIDISCDNGVTYTAAINGNGNWGTPALDVNSHSALVPVWFGEITGIATDSEGNSFELFSEPPTTKGAGKHADVDCTFTDEFSFTDPEAGPLTVVVTGEVKGFITPRH
jgi:hypothetical protein